MLEPASKVRAIHGRSGSPRAISSSSVKSGLAGARVAVGAGVLVDVGVGDGLAVGVEVGIRVGVGVEVAVGSGKGVGLGGKN
jgi:hypothetical protein